MKSRIQIHILTLAACLSASTATFAADVVGQAGPLGGQTPQSPAEGGCGELLINADGTYEMPYAWQYSGVVPPDWGSFAECYEGEFAVCAVTIDLVQTGDQNGQTMDVYVWDDEGGEPGAVLCVEPGVDPGPVAFWPSVSRHEITLGEPCCTGEAWWVGYWPDWPGDRSAWFLAGDLDGFDGCPLTKVAPGIGFPTGWQNVSVIWGPTQAMGLGALVQPCEPTPTLQSGWGAIKTLYR
ncbi:MAG: hypothetical protein H6682_16490 [Candidatus Eisenbacteria bacterium]|nr:hypothetical protein [Candidatus Eisenbacteria bacterium]